MLRITQQSQSAAAKAYYSQPDYYIDGQEMAGVWGGKGATMLGLEGEVAREPFHHLCDNLLPDGSGPLTARSRTDRTVGYDFTFNVPKSVSLVATLANDKAITTAVESAVEETMREVEESMQTRVRKRGLQEDRTTGNMVWGRFTHFTTRPVDGVPDPHLHVHVFAFNATYDAVEGSWKAGQFRGLKRDARYYEAAFHARLAEKIRDLGYGIERTKAGSGWEIAGFEKETLDRFSRRTALIEKTAQEKGITNPEDKAALGAKTRSGKDKSLGMNELEAEWLGRLGENEKASLKAVAEKKVQDRGPIYGAAEAMAWAVGHAFTRMAVLREKALLAFALRQGVGGVSVNEMWKELAGHGILTRKDSEERFVTTEEVLREEQETVAFAKLGRGTSPSLGSADRKLSREWLSADQQRAVEHILGSHDRVILVRGSAGTGKTTMMQEAVEGIRENGKDVLVLAPSIGASRGVLRDAGFENADTVARFLIDAKFQQEAAGQVVWVDEAGLLSGRQMHELFEIAKNVGARVVLCGDPRQHRSVERGDVLRQLEQFAGLPVPELTDIKRQEGEYRQAVGLLSEGLTEEALERFEDMGWIKTLEDGEREKQLARDYLEAIKAGKTVLAVSPTHAEADKVTEAIRGAMKDEGSITGEERTIETWTAAHLTQAEQGDPLSYRAGDLLQFHKRVKGFNSGARVLNDGKAPLPLDHPEAFQVFRRSSLRVAKGDRIRITARGKTKDQKHQLTPGKNYTIAGISKRGDIELDNGWVLDKDFGHLAHGYVSTSWASQGATVDHVFIAQSGLSHPASSAEQLYVSASRGKKALTLYTDSLEALRDAVGHGERRLTALDRPEGRDFDWVRYRFEHLRRRLNGPQRHREPSPDKRKDFAYDG